MSDSFSSTADTVSAPGRKMFAITPHATNALNPIPKAIRCDVAGTVALRAIDSSVDVSITMAAGEVLAVRAQYVRAAGTTATLHGMG
tara:strand:+ start:895 stop:1155 length:261 start_codon:yes stop_codon:yes gene_type:complete